MTAARLALLVLMLAAPAAAQSPDMPGTMLELVRANDCRMTMAEARDVLPGAGIPMEVAENIAETWDALGQATIDGNTLILGPQLCSGGAPTSAALAGVDGADDAGLMAAIRANGCRMSEAEATAAGIDTDAARDTVMAWVSAGRARADGDDVVLSGDECHVRDMPQEDFDGRRAVFVAVVEAEGCQMDEDLAETVLPPKGFERSETYKFVQDLMGRGQAQLDGPTLMLTTSGCQ